MILSRKKKVKLSYRTRISTFVSYFSANYSSEILNVFTCLANEEE